MPTITWVETLPSNGSAVGRSPSEIRQPMSSVALGLGAWLEWPGSGSGSELLAGQPKAGAARPYFAPSSAKSLASPQQLFLTSDTTRLYYMTSAGTVQVGSVQFLEHKSSASTSYAWVMQSGSTVLAGKAIRLDFPVTFAEAPVVIPTTTYTSMHFSVRAVSAESVTIDARRFGGSDDTTLNWLALGKVALT